MQVVFWAFGSMLAFLLILAFLPIGLTIKGKVVTAVAGLALALAGLLASAVLSIWQTVLVLVLLILSTTYILNRRLESVLYSKTSSEPEFIDEGVEDFPVYESARGKSSKEPITDMPFMIVSEITPEDVSPDLSRKAPALELEPIQLEMLEEESLFPVLEGDESPAGQKNNAAEPLFDEGYLSEIESLLAENKADELLVVK